MKTLREVTVALALMAASAAIPAAALADPPAVEGPAPIPGPFVGAPVNSDPNAGQFTVNFDDQGRFEGVGRPQEHYDNFDLGPGRVRQQGRAPTTSARESQSVDALFAKFQQQLRDIAAPQAAQNDSRR